MVTVNIREARRQLSKLVDRAAAGEPFLIAKAGKPVVQVSALGTRVAPQRLGFLAGEIAVPDDFDRMLPAGALTEGVTLLTADAQPARSSGSVRKKSTAQ